MTNIETRNGPGGVPGTVVFEHAGRQGGKRIGGYAAVYGRPSKDLGGFIETVDRRAFNKTLADGADVLASFNHDPIDKLLGRTASGTLTLDNGADGLRYVVSLPNTAVGRDVAELVERGDLRGSSFSFRAIRDEWSTTEGGTPVRRLLEVALKELGPVSQPAYPDASVAMRSLGAARSIDLEELAEASAEGRLAERLAAGPSRRRRWYLL